MDGSNGAWVVMSRGKLVANVFGWMEMVFITLFIERIGIFSVHARK